MLRIVMHGADKEDKSSRMKFANDRPLADREKAARKLLEIAHTVEPVQDGRIHFEKIDAPSCTGSAARRPNTAPG